MSRFPDSRIATTGGLMALLLALPWWLYTNGIAGLVWFLVIGMLVPGLLIYAALKKTRNWSGITALCMIPIACIGVMDIVASAEVFNAGTALAVISIATFFAALDAGRRDTSQGSSY